MLWALRQYDSLAHKFLTCCRCNPCTLCHNPPTHSLLKKLSMTILALALIRNRDKAAQKLDFSNSINTRNMASCILPVERVMA